MPKIIALEKRIEDPGSGAEASYHVVVQYQVQLFNGRSSVTLAGYVSRAAHEDKKRPLMHTTVPLGSQPTGDSATWPEWFYDRVLQRDAAVVDSIAGATPVYELEAEAEEPAA